MVDIDQLLKYYREFRTDLWIIQTKYEESPYLHDLIMQLSGRIAMLEELSNKKPKEENKK